MKKFISVLAISAFTVALTVIAAPANAVNCRSFNGGTFTAAHMHSANGNGLVMIAMQCHGFGG